MANLPWIEKYRPATLDELVSHKDIIDTIKRYMTLGELPHLLFYGPAGTGKTSTILALAKQMYTPTEMRGCVLELNASDDRGIGIVRDEIQTFVSTQTLHKKSIKLIILDEADAMTTDAQNALRRIIEQYTATARFCFICNYLSKIIPAVQSRCTRFRFGPLSNEQMMPRLQHVIDKENVQIDQDGKKAILQLANGDMRRALNILQSTHMASSLVTETSVYECVGHPSKNDVKTIINVLLNENFTVASQTLATLKTTKGYALADILTELHRYVHKIDFPREIRIHLLVKMADIEYRLANGATEKLQLSALISTFQKARQVESS
jgi:replication factor C subunit 3/5